MDKLREFHMSDCAVHNEPAMRMGPCNCGAKQNIAINWLKDQVEALTIQARTFKKS